MKEEWGPPAEVELPKNHMEAQELMGESLEKGIHALKEGCRETFCKAKEHYIEAAKQEEKRDSQYYKEEMEHYLELVKEHPGVELYEIGYKDAGTHYYEELQKEQSEQQRAEQVKGLLGKTSYDYIDEMVEAKFDGNLSRYMDVYHQFEHYYNFTPNGWIERARGLDFWEAMGVVDKKLFERSIKGY